MLGVAPTASLADVRSAYRRLARSAHPDAAGNCADNTAMMTALSDAYRLLVRYARAHDADRCGDSRVSEFDIDAPAMFVSIRTPEAQTGARIGAES
jgi:DnaJ-class molecular chaperone